MYTYALLEPGCYYLIQEKKELPISLIRINVESDHCVFVSRYRTKYWNGKKVETHHF
jgi:hypothetical protein